MGSSGSTDNLPVAPPRLANLNPSRVATIEQARSVPYIFGVARVGLTFLGEPFNVHQDPVYQETKKEPIQSGFNNYGSFVALVGIGGVSTRLYKVIIDDEVVWSGDISYSSSDYQDVTVTGRGTLRFYFGTETQGIDSNLPLDGDGNPLHPGYRGQCYVILLNWFIGYNQGNLGNVQLEIGRYPAPAWQTAAANVQADLNAVSLLADWWTNPRVGLGQGSDRLDTDDLDDVAATLAGECVGLSGLIGTATPARQQLLRLCEHIGAYLKRQPSGKLTLGLERPIACATSVPALEEADLLSPPDYTPGDWADTFNRIYVKFIDRSNAMLEDAAPYKSPTNLQLTGAIKTQIVDRTWITRQVYAQQLANILGPTLAVPRGKGKLRVRRSRLQGIKAGDVFKLSYGHFGICHLRCRATAVRLPSTEKPEVEIEFKEDTSGFNARYSSVSEHDRPERSTYEPEPVEHQIAFEIPFSPHLPVRAEAVAFLAVRPTNFTTKFAAHRQLADTTYAKVQNDLPFVQRATLYADYGSTRVIDESGTLILQLAGVDLTLPLNVLDEAVLNGVVAWIGDELLSIYNATLVAAGRYVCSAIRARYDTRRATHSTGDVAWIFYPARLVPYAVESAAQTQAFKLQPFTFSGALDLGDATALNLTRTQRILRPASPLNLRAFGLVSPTFTSGQDIPLTWNTATNERSDFWTVFTANLPSVELDMVDSMGVVKATYVVAVGTEAFTYTNSQLRADLGGEDNFTVRAYHVLNGYRSSLAAELAVTLSGAGSSAANQATLAAAEEIADSLGTGTGVQAFDGYLVTVWEGIGSLPVWLRYKFTANRTIATYRLYSTVTRHPTAWTFQGSADGSSWTTLDTQSGVTDWSDGIGKTYAIGSPSGYRYYRINISAVAVAPYLTQLEMFL